MKTYEKNWPAQIGLSLNGKPVTAMLDDPGAMACSFLRTALAARDVPAACGQGNCGACLILIDGEPVLSCITPAARLDGAVVETRRGVMAQEDGQSVARAISRNIAPDACGYCLGGNIVLGTWLRREGAARPEVEAAFSGQLCACSGREPYITATLAVDDPSASESPPKKQP